MFGETNTTDSTGTDDAKIPQNPWCNEEIVKGACPNDWESMDEHPEILAGTFNKLFEYTRSMYLWMHAMFHDSLQRSTRLVVCGYGFGDKGINNQVTEWMSHDSKNVRKMIVADMDPFANARGAIRSKVEGWERMRKCIILKGKFGSGGKLTWNDILGETLK